MSEIVAGVEDVASAERILEHALVEVETTGRALQVVNAWTLPYWFADVTGMATVPMPLPPTLPRQLRRTPATCCRRPCHFAARTPRGSRPPRWQSRGRQARSWSRRRRLLASSSSAVAATESSGASCSGQLPFTFFTRPRARSWSFRVPRLPAATRASSSPWTPAAAQPRLCAGVSMPPAGIVAQLTSFTYSFETQRRHRCSPERRTQIKVPSVMSGCRHSCQKQPTRPSESSHYRGSRRFRVGSHPG